MPAANAGSAGPGAETGSRVDLSEIEDERGFPRPPVGRIASVADGLMQTPTGSNQSQGKIAARLGTLGTAGNNVIEKQPRPAGPPALKLPQRPTNAGPNGTVPPRGPGGVRQQTELTVVTSAGVGSSENVIGALRPAKGVAAFRPPSEPLAPSAKRKFDLPGRGV